MNNERGVSSRRRGALAVGALVLVLHGLATLGWGAWTWDWPPEMRALRWGLTLVERDASSVVAGQWWRLGTAPWFHVTWVHALTTAFALAWAFAAEPRFSMARLAQVYAVAVLAGALVVAAERAGLPAGNAVGASMMLAAWLGLTAAGWDPAQRSAVDLWRAVSVPILVIGLAELSGGADTAGHLAGVGVGFSIGHLAARARWGPVARRGAWVLLLVLLVAGAGSAWRHALGCAATVNAMSACAASLAE